MKACKHFSPLQTVLVLVGILLVLLAAPPHPAQAHANLTRSDPEMGAALREAPPAVTLEFSESLDQAFSKARLVDARNVVVVAGPGKIDPGNPRQLMLDLPPLPDGAYSLIWQVRSAVDAHITEGTLSFSVGQGAPPASLLPPAGSPLPARARPAPIDTFLRWFSYLAAALLTGSVSFAWLIWRPAYGSWETPDPSADELAAHRLRRLAITSALGLILLTVLFALYQAWQASRGAFSQPFGLALLELLDSHNGPLFWTRLLLLAFILLLSRTLPGPGAGSRRPWMVLSALSLGVLLTFSLRSHGAALGSAWAVALDWLHLATVSVWFGGLLALLLSLRASGIPAQRLVPSFSRVALACVAILALTGLGSAWLHVRTLQALLSTFYGNTLAFKVFLFGIILCLAAINLLILSPRLQERLGTAGNRLNTTIRFELALGALILLASGLLAGSFPAQEALEAERRMGYVGAYAQDGVRLDLWVSPAKAGENEYAVDVEGVSVRPGDPPPEVLLRFHSLDYDLGISQVETQDQGKNRYGARGSYLSIAGDWQIEVILRQAGQDDIRHAFDLQIQAGPGESGFKNDIQQADLNGQARTVMEDAFWPVVSPDGSRIAYLTVDPLLQNNDLYIANADGSRPMPVIPPEALPVDDHLFTADGKGLIFSMVNPDTAPASTWLDRLFGIQVASAHNIPSDWYFAPAAGGMPERLTNLNDLSFSGDLSPDGKYMIFVNSTGLYLMPLDSREVYRISADVTAVTVDWLP